MQRKRKIPSKPNFKRATKRAYEFLLELDVKEFPIDPFKIIKRFEDNWHLLSWTELKINTGVEDPFNLKRNGAEAATKIQRGTNDYIIVYDDSFSMDRIRWTIAHEIGHIVLGHLVYYEETALNRGGLTQEQYGVLEVEAHWFAGILLSPHVVLNLYDVKDIQEIAFLCNISKEAAEKCEGYLNKFRPQFVDLERKLVRNFYNFFFKHRFLQSIANGIYKFNGSYLYDEFYKICRICRSCNSYITDKNQKFCHVCGQPVPDWDFPYKDLPINGVWRGWPEYLEGKYYPYIEVDNNKRVLYCPVCKNQDFDEDATYCKICGTPLYNTCLSENTKVSGACRYCPNCGETTKFQELNLFDNLKEVQIPDLLTFENGKYEDYIEYEYWNYIIATVYYFKRDLELYTALDGSKAIRDEGSFIVFAANAMSADIILNHQNLLMECIKEYGQTIITNVGCYYYDL